MSPLREIEGLLSASLDGVVLTLTLEVMTTQQVDLLLAIPSSVLRILKERPTTFSAG